MGYDGERPEKHDGELPEKQEEMPEPESFQLVKKSHEEVPEPESFQLVKKRHEELPPKSFQLHVVKKSPEELSRPESFQIVKLNQRKHLKKKKALKNIVRKVKVSRGDSDPMTRAVIAKLKRYDPEDMPKVKHLLQEGHVDDKDKRYKVLEPLKIPYSQLP